MRDKFPWTDGQVAILKRMWSNNTVSSEIGDALGCSRMAVIGKARRLGLASRKAASWRRAKKIVRRKEPRTHKPKPETPKPVTKMGGLARRQPAPLPVILPRSVRPPLKGILDLQPGDCRFPEGSPGTADFGFCGRPVESGKVYCSGCCQKAYQRRKPNAVNDLERAEEKRSAA